MIISIDAEKAFEKIKIISSIFSDHNVVRLDVNYGGKKLLKVQTYGS